MTAPSVHGCAVQVGEHAVLIRGPSGAGKSRLALALIDAGRAGLLPRTVLIGDDRIRLEARNDALIVHAVAGLEGRIEVYGLGIRRCPFIAQGRVGLVVDLAATDAERLPPAAALETQIDGIKIPRIPVARDHNPLLPVVAWFTMEPEK